MGIPHLAPGPTNNDDLTDKEYVLSQSLEFDPSYILNNYFIYDDFLNDNTTSGSIGSHGWTSVLTGTGGISAAASDLVAAGYINLQVQTPLNDRAYIRANNYTVTGSPAYILQSRWLLSSTTNCKFQLGLGAGNTNIADFTDGAWFQMDSSVSTNLFAKVRRASGVMDSFDCGVFTTGAWHTTKIVSDGVGNISFYLDGVLAGTSTAATGKTPLIVLTLMSGIIQQGNPGVAQRTLRLDYHYFKASFSRTI